MEKLINTFWLNNVKNAALIEIIEYGCLYLSKKQKGSNKNLKFFLLKNSILYLEKQKKKERKFLEQRFQILAFFILFHK